MALAKPWLARETTAQLQSTALICRMKLSHQCQNEGAEVHHLHECEGQNNVREEFNEEVRNYERIALTNGTNNGSE